MKRSFGLLAAVIAAALTPQALRADAPLCPLENYVMNGIYVLSGTGTVLGTGGGPVAYQGVVTYNGDGTGTVDNLTQNVNGTVYRLTMLPATFTVKSDCTGSKTVGTGASVTHYDFVITPDGHTITFIETDAGAVTSGTAVRLSR